MECILLRGQQKGDQSSKSIRSGGHDGPNLPRETERKRSELHHSIANVTLERKKSTSKEIRPTINAVMSNPKATVTMATNRSGFEWMPFRPEIGTKSAIFSN